MNDLEPETVRDLIHWGKTLCLPTQTPVEWNVWQLACALEYAQDLLERLDQRTTHTLNPETLL